MKRLTIGIPCYNEANNLARLIPIILGQKGVNIEEIIVSSDGSTDNTTDVINSFSSKKIKLIANKKRSGISRGLNQIIDLSTSEILVTLDADIQIFDDRFIHKLTQPILQGGTDLTSASISPLNADDHYQKMLYLFAKIKGILFNNFNSGNNIYTCYGLARGFSKRFYKSLHFPTSIGNDMYSYLECMNKGYKFTPLKNAKVYYQLPNNFQDYEAQSIRFYKSLKKQNSYFGSILTRKHTYIPSRVYIKSFSKISMLLILHPTYVLSYILLQIYFRFKSMLSYQPETWAISKSTKIFTNYTSK